MNSHSAVVNAAAPMTKASWLAHLVALSVAVASILAMFQYEIAAAVDVWWNYPTYSHCFLILPISAWLIWEKRHQLAHKSLLGTDRDKSHHEK